MQLDEAELKKYKGLELTKNVISFMRSIRKDSVVGCQVLDCLDDACHMLRQNGSPRSADVNMDIANRVLCSLDDSSVSSDERVRVIQWMIPVVREAGAADVEDFQSFLRVLGKAAPAFRKLVQAGLVASERFNVVPFNPAEVPSSADLLKLLDQQKSAKEAVFTAMQDGRVIQALKTNLNHFSIKGYEQYAAMRKLEEELVALSPDSPEDLLARERLVTQMDHLKKEINCEKFKSNVRDLGDLAKLLGGGAYVLRKFGLPDAVVGSVAELGRTVKVIELGYTIFGSLANRVVIAAKSGPLAPYVFAMQALQSMIELFSPREPSERELIQQVSEQIKNMHADIRKLIIDGDRLNHDRFLKLSRALMSIEDQVSKRFDKTDRTLDELTRILKSVRAQLGEKFDDVLREQKNLETIFLQSARQQYVKDKLNAFDLYRGRHDGSLTEKAISESWNNFYVHIVMASKGSALAGSKGCAMTKDRPFEYQMNVLAERAQLTTYLANPLIWAEGILDAIRFGESYREFYLDDARVEQWHAMVDVGEKLRKFIRQLKSNPDFFDTLLNQYVAVVEQLSEESDRLSYAEFLMGSSKRSLTSEQDLQASLNEGKGYLKNFLFESLRIIIGIQKTESLTGREKDGYMLELNNMQQIYGTGKSLLSGAAKKRLSEIDAKISVTARRAMPAMSDILPPDLAAEVDKVFNTDEVVKEIVRLSTELEVRTQAIIPAQEAVTHAVKALEEMYQLLLAFVQLAFHDHEDKKLQSLIENKLWSRDVFSSYQKRAALDPITPHFCDHRSKELFPAIAILRVELAKSTAQFKAMPLEEIPSEYSLLDSVFEQIQSFEALLHVRHVMGRKKSAVEAADVAMEEVPADSAGGIRGTVSHGIHLATFGWFGTARTKPLSAEKEAAAGAGEKRPKPMDPREGFEGGSAGGALPPPKRARPATGAVIGEEVAGSIASSMG